MVRLWMVGLLLVAAGWGRTASAQVDGSTFGVASVAGAAEAPWIGSPIGPTDEPLAPWRLALLPRQSKPVTQFSVMNLDSQRVLRVTASKSYGKLLHPLKTASKLPRRLSWDWRVDTAPEADLRKRSGDDVALRVCAFFDWPIERVPAAERARLALAELIAGEPVPTAALCYVWDTALPTGTVMPNAFTRRLRMIVVDGEGAAAREWREHMRDLHKDFRAAFADEWQDGDEVPAVTGILIGADTDNTGGESLGYLRSIVLTR